VLLPVPSVFVSPRWSRCLRGPAFAGFALFAACGPQRGDARGEAEPSVASEGIETGALFYNECISVRQTFGRYDPATRRLAPDSVGRQLYVVKVFEYNVDIYGLSTSRGVTDTVVLAPSHSRAPGASLEFASQLTRSTNTVLPTRASLRYSYNLARQRLLVREQRSASGAPGVAVEFELLPFEALDSVMAQPRVY
jgi:hypothetical protein